MTSGIYFLKDMHTGWIKIGRSDNVERRIRTHISSNPSAVLLHVEPWTAKELPAIEATYHRIFHKRYSGFGEWFIITEDDVTNSLRKPL